MGEGCLGQILSQGLGSGVGFTFSRAHPPVNDLVLVPNTRAYSNLGGELDSAPL